MKNVKKLFAIIFTVILVMGFMGCGDSAEEQAENLKSNLIELSQDAVKTKLKCPSTAKFPWGNDEYGTKELATGNPDLKQYLVAGNVDAQNSFGAQIRNRFVVKIQLTSDLKKYKILDVKIMEN